MLIEKSLLNIPQRFIKKCDAVSFEIKPANTPPTFLKFESTFLKKELRIYLLLFKGNLLRL